MSALKVLNVDLEIRADIDLWSLAEALQGAGLLLISEETVQYNLSAFELGIQPSTPAHVFPAPLLRSISDLGASLTMTIYPIEVR